MSVEVRQLTKVYGQQRAVDDLSFSTRAGQILGFLGPNGAGKSTTMKMLTGYIAPSSGDATVAGYSILEDSLEVRRKVGYLPEHNPLYLNMYVREYLQFVAGVHRIKDKKKRIESLIDMTGLGREQHKLVGALSKGYRQRVGLAQAMIHDPEVLILDEPTSGLDMNQLVEIRSLIKALGQEKTVIFSTHIMQEVQALCDQVVIIDQGKLVANDPIERLQSRIAGQTVIHLTVLEQDKDHTPMLTGLEGVTSATSLGRGSYQITVTAKTDCRPMISRAVTAAGATIIDMRKEVFTVEEIFQQLTTKDKGHA
jgi:ABC-2 type transport system ATP-binding protein